MVTDKIEEAVKISQKGISNTRLRLITLMITLFASLTFLIVALFFIIFKKIDNSIYFISVFIKHSNYNYWCYDRNYIR